MKKIRILVIFFVSVMAGLGGCGISGRPETSGPETMRETVFPFVYENKIERVSFQTELVIPADFKQENLTEATVELKLPDMENVKNIWMKRLDGKEIKEEFNDPATRDYPFPYYSILTEDAFSMSIGRGISYRTPFNHYFSAALKYDEQRNLLSEYSKCQELKGLSEEEIWTQVKEEAELLGYSLEGNVKAYALPYNLLREQESWTDIDGNNSPECYKESWTREDDTWYFLIHQTFQDLPVYHQYVYPDCNDENTPIRIAYSRRGLENFTIDYFFEFQEQNTKLKLVDFDKIAQTVADKYNDLLTNADYTVTRATLFQSVVRVKENEYFVTPAWNLDITESSPEGDYNFTMLVEAVSGEEIVQ